MDREYSFNFRYLENSTYMLYKVCLLCIIYNCEMLSLHATPHKTTTPSIHLKTTKSFLANQVLYDAKSVTGQDRVVTKKLNENEGFRCKENEGMNNT